MKAILTNLFDMKKSLEKEAKKKKTKLKMPWLYFQIYYFLFPNLKTYYSLDVKLLPVTHDLRYNLRYLAPDFLLSFNLFPFEKIPKNSKSSVCKK